MSPPGPTCAFVLVDGVIAFGSLVITLLEFRAGGASAYRDAVDAQDGGASEEGHAMLGFFDDDAVGLLLGCGRGAEEKRGEDACLARDRHGSLHWRE